MLAGKEPSLEECWTRGGNINSRRLSRWSSDDRDANPFASRQPL